MQGHFPRKDVSVMKFWEAVILLNYIRKGATEDEATALLPKMSARIRNGLHSLGLDYRRIDAEYPEYLYLHDLNLAKNHPEKFDKAVMESQQWFCSRN